MAQGVELATGYVSLAVDGSHLSRGINDAVNKAGGKAQKSGGGIGSKLAAGMGKTLKVGAVATGGAVAGVLAVSLTKGFKRLNAIDEAKKKLSGLGYTAKQITGIMNASTDAVKGTAYGLDDAASAAAGALASGIKPGKELTKYLSLTGDAAAQSGTSFTSMAQMMNKVEGQGKLTGDVVSQMADNGLYVMPMLAKAYHKPQAAMQKMVSSGKISAKEFQTVLEKNIGGSAKKSGDTVKGAWANMNASLGRIGANLLSGVFPKIAPMLQNITKRMAPLEKAAEGVGSKIGGVFADGFDGAGKVLGSVDWGRILGAMAQALSSVDWAGIGRTIGSVASALGDFAHTVGGQLADMIQSVDWAEFGKGMSDAFSKIGPLADTISGIASGIVDALFPIFAGAFKGAIKAFPHVLGGAIDALQILADILKPMTPVIAGLIGAIVTYKAVMGTINAVTRIATAAQLLFNTALELNPIGLIIAALVGLAIALVVAYKKSATFRRIVNAAFGAVKRVVMGVVNWFKKSFVPFFTKTIPHVFQSLMNWVKSHWKLIASLITGPIGAAVILVVSNWGKIRHAFSAAWSWVSHAFRAAWNGLRTILTKPISSARTLISSTIGKIRGALSGVWSWASRTFRHSWSGLTSIFTHPISVAKSAISRLFSGKGGIQSVFRSGLKAIKKIWHGLGAAIAKPTNAIISGFNKSFVAGFNKLGSPFHVHIGGIPEIPGYDTGGPIRGVFRGAHADNVLIRATPGEHMTPYGPAQNMRRKFPGYLEHIQRYGTPPGYDLGGWIGGVAKKATGGVGDVIGDVKGGVTKLWDKLAGNAIKIARTIQYAAGQLGKPYVFGSAGPNAFDCSGLVQQAYAHGAGMHLPHLANSQMHMGKKVTGTPAPGDLLGTVGGHPIPHVALAVGNGNLIEAANPKLGVIGPHAIGGLPNGARRLIGGVNQHEVSALSAMFAGIKKVGQFAAKFNPFNALKGVLTKPLEAVRKSFGNNPAARLGAGEVVNLATGMIDWAASKVGSLFGGGGGGTSGLSGSAKGMVPEIANGLGVGKQVAAIDYIFKRESNFNPLARNASSGAYGIPQALPGNKMASAGPDWKTNPATQIAWGIQYMKERYGSPKAAMAYWKVHHNYAAGTTSAARGINGVAENGAELVLSPQLRRFSGGEQVLSARQTDRFVSAPRGGTPGLSLTLNGVQLDNAGEVASQILWELRRSSGGKYAAVA